MKQINIILDKPSRKEVNVTLDKEGQEVEILGLVLGHEKGTYELVVNATHKNSNSKAKILVKGIAQRGAFVKISGMVTIEKNIQGIDDFLELRVLVLDDESKAIVDPKMEILSNEVKAGHAATVGQIDSEQIFYLKSRGLTENQAKKVIVDGFLREITDRIETS